MNVAWLASGEGRAELRRLIAWRGKGGVTPQCAEEEGNEVSHKEMGEAAAQGVSWDLHQMLPLWGALFQLRGFFSAERICSLL